MFLRPDNFVTLSFRLLSLTKISLIFSLPCVVRFALCEKIPPIFLLMAPLRLIWLCLVLSAGGFVPIATPLVQNYADNERSPSSIAPNRSLNVGNNDTMPPNVNAVFLSMT